VQQFVDCGSTVWEVEYLGGYTPSWIDGSSLRKALEVAPVSLTADCIVPFNTPMLILCCAASGSMWYVLSSLDVSGGIPRYSEGCPGF
jgi:hypothetical protein